MFSCLEEGHPLSEADPHGLASGQEAFVVGGRQRISSKEETGVISSMLEQEASADGGRQCASSEEAALAISVKDVSSRLSAAESGGQTSRGSSRRNSKQSSSRKASSTSAEPARPSFIMKSIRETFTKLRSPRQRITTQVWYTKSTKEGPTVLLKAFDGEVIGRIDASEHVKTKEVMTPEVSPPGRTVVLPDIIQGELEENWRRWKEQRDKLEGKDAPVWPVLQDSSLLAARNKPANHVVGERQRLLRDSDAARLRNMTNVVEQDTAPMNVHRLRTSVSMPCMPVGDELRDADITTSLHSNGSFRVPHRPVSPRKFNGKIQLKSNSPNRRRAVVMLARSDDISEGTETSMFLNTYAVTNSVGSVYESKLEAVQHTDEVKLTSLTMGV